MLRFKIVVILSTFEFEKFIKKNSNYGKLYPYYFSNINLWKLF